MKKIKWTIMILVISLSVGAAFATAPHFDCRTAQQYYLTGGGYMPVGVFLLAGNPPERAGGNHPG